MSSIGRLQRVPLREVWKHEAYDFTQWLEENIDVLNAALNLNIVSAIREQAAGSFSIDLVAEDEGGGTIVIENQLEKSNHDHLGKLITYLTAMSARAAIWIVSEPRPEHVAAIAWLNESSSADFYLAKVEAVRIGESPAAPLLTLIVGPSDEAKEAGRAKQEISEQHAVRKRWWTMLVARQDAKLHAHITPSSVSWLGTSSGIRGVNFNYGIRQDGCLAELYIDRGRNFDHENKSIFDQLLAHKDQIESSIQKPMKWDRLDDKRASRIAVVLEGGYRNLEAEWPEIQTLQVKAMNDLERALKPYLRQLKMGS